jgi:hypothetical protein
VVSFIPWPLYPWGKNPWYPLDKRLVESQSQSGCCGLEENLMPLPGIEPELSSLYPITIPTELISKVKVEGEVIPVVI